MIAKQEEMVTYSDKTERGLTNTVYTVSPNAPVSEVVRLMVSHNLGDVVVVDDQKPVGMLTDRDILVRVTAAGLNAKETRVRVVMSTPPIMVRRTEDLNVAIALMSRHGIRRLPIVDDGGRLCSILTLDDLLLLGLEDCPDLSGIVRQQLRAGQEVRKPFVTTAVPSSIAPARPERFVSRKPVSVVTRASVIVPMPAYRPPTKLEAARSWLFDNSFWLVTVLILSLLGAVGALLANQLGHALYEYNPTYYEPKDEERRLFLEERRLFFDESEQERQGAEREQRRKQEQRERTR